MGCMHRLGRDKRWRIVAGNRRCRRVQKPGMCGCRSESVGYVVTIGADEERRKCGLRKTWNRERNERSGRLEQTTGRLLQLCCPYNICRPVRRRRKATPDLVPSNADGSRCSAIQGRSPAGITPGMYDQSCAPVQAEVAPDIDRQRPSSQLRQARALRQSRA
jgi:hypothetical protein